MRCLTVLLVVLSIIGFALSGCNGIEPGATLPDTADVSLDANEPAPPGGVWVERSRYNFLIRCEGYVIRQGVNP